MLPTHFSQNVFSLCREAEKNVLSLYIDFDNNLQMRCCNLKLQRILIRENLSYSEVDRQRNNPDYEVLNRISTKLRDQRDTAQEKERFYYTLKAKDGKVTARKVDTQSPSRMMIEELMILYNRSIAQYAIGNNLPLLYRNINQFLDENQEVRNSSAFLSTSPGYHPGIGAEAYLHATSPIRRVVDLINQMQVCNLLCEQQILFSKDTLNYMIPNIEKRILQIRETVFRSERYWFLKYIEQEQMNKPLEAFLKGYVNGKLKAAILPWGKQVLLDTDAKPEDDYFHFAVYAVDWDGQFLKADVIG
jgi:exoribonuclease R